MSIANYLIFPTPVTEVTNLLPDEEVSELQELATHMYKHTEGNNHGFNCDVWSNIANSKIDEDKRFKKLLDRIVVEARRFLDMQGMEDDIELYNAWLNVYEANHYQDRHFHPNSAAACIYYLSAPEGSSPLTLYKPYDPLLQSVKKNNELYAQFGETYEVKTETNKLVIIPSHIYHSVGRGFNKELRMSVATNLEYVR